MRAVPLSTPIDASLSRVQHPTVWRRLLREPLLHFALIGALIFAAAHVVSEARRASQARIVVDGALRERLGNLHRAQFGVLPTKAQLDTIVESYVDDEVLYREAIELGLDQDDEIIRRRLIQKLEFLQREASDQPDAGVGGASDAELRAYYDSHRAQFSEPARVSFSHLYFSPDRGEADAFARATRAHAELLATDHAVAADVFPLDTSYDAISRDDATRVFGLAPMVDALFAQGSAGWSQPVRSGFGWHLVKITAFSAPRVAPYDEVVPDVRAIYLQERSALTKRKQLDALRARYHVEYASTAAGQSR